MIATNYKVTSTIGHQLSWRFGAGLKCLSDAPVHVIHVDNLLPTGWLKIDAIGMTFQLQT